MNSPHLAKQSQAMSWKVQDTRSKGIGGCSGTM